MALSEKVDSIKSLVSLLCEVLPKIISLIIEVVQAIREVKIV